MDKKEEKVQTVNENLEKCEMGYSKVYLQGSIPKKILRNACKGYADELFGKKVLQEDVIGLIDTSVKGNGKTGMLLTEEGVFYKSFGESAGYYSYKEIRKMGKVPKISDTDCNKREMMRLLSKLAAIDDKRSLLDISESKMDEAMEAIDKLNKILDKLGDVFRELELFIFKIKREMESKRF